ncbi:hypothetical protein GJ496_009159 [Pomphorhynchus laevis]|nr:hypothetical protein GJ496_009159 [Pomphorhynchus laevis]
MSLANLFHVVIVMCLFFSASFGICNDNEIQHAYPLWMSYKFEIAMVGIFVLILSIIGAIGEMYMLHSWLIKKNKIDPSKEQLTSEENE